MTKGCKRCGAVIGPEDHRYRLQLIKMRNDDSAVDIIETVLCYVCRRSFGRWMRDDR